MTKAEKYLFDVHMILMTNCGVLSADRKIDPLAYYINSGRASALFLNRLYEIKPEVIAESLNKEGSCKQAMGRIFKLISFVPYNY